MTMTEESAKLFEKIRGRCVIDDDAGCWLWGGAMSGPAGGTKPGAPTMKVGLPGGGEKQRTVASLVWELTHTPLPNGLIVWRTCGECRCVQPLHLQRGTRAQRQRYFSKGGVWRGNLIRDARCMAASLSRTLPRADVQIIEAMLDAEVTPTQIRTVLGHSMRLICRVRDGAHRHSRGRPLLSPAASVFAWAQQL